MGACHATSKIHSSRRSSKKQNTSASSPSTDKPINNKEDNSDLDLSGETIPNADLYVTNLNISPSLVIFFGTFYKKRLTALQNADTFVSNPAKKAAFLQKLAKLNDIDIEVAHIWVKAYIDYMILMAWLYFAVEEKEMYAPFAIQQTQRLHIASFADYKAFCHVLTEGKSIIHYSPRKIVTNNQNIDLIESSYDELKESMMIYLYENSQIFPDSSQVEEVKEIWESFYETFIKNEYSFCLSKSARSTSTISKSSIQKAIAGVSTDNHNFSLATEGLSLLRAALNLSMDYKPETNTSVLSAINSDALTENEINMAKIVDEIKFPIGFSHLLSWEQVITITEAQEWVLEYKKLIFSSLQGKSIEGDFSEKVKQVWLLHMSFTRNYQKFFVEHLAKNELKMSTSFEDIEQENRCNTMCVNFYNDIIKKQEDLLNMKLATALTE